MKRLLADARVQGALAWLLAGWLGFVHRTTRWQVVMAPESEALMRQGRPLILALWHERLPPLVCQWTRFPDRGRAPVHPLHFIISTHRDGRLVARIAANIGVATVEGSTSRGGREALQRALAILAEGQAAIGITPDGPRGPRRVPQPGVAALAKLSGRPVVCAGAATARNRRLKSWDRMMLSWPFGRGAIVVKPPLSVPRDMPQQQALDAIKALLDDACHEADTLVGAAPG
jgi:lysophospholipid acyltransferase (LPLAT)-like uncharacterized protein